MNNYQHNAVNIKKTIYIKISINSVKDNIHDDVRYMNFIYKQNLQLGQIVDKGFYKI